MVFSSSIFLFIFLPVTLGLYFFAAERYRNAVLLCASLFFYAWGEPKHIALMLLSILVNYVFGLLVAKERRHRRFWLVTAVVYNLGMLFFFKYLNFAVRVAERVSGYAFDVPSVTLPIGISFYTFQIMSYVIDVYRGDTKSQKNIAKLALYVSLFPQLIAGPIVRYADVAAQIDDRSTTCERARAGIVTFVLGFSKKVLLADQLATLVDTCFAGTYPSVLNNWIGIIAYTLQIYYDFSGYSDMAIGLGRIFGFDFLENFDHPYISQSIQEFWRRWHMSLGSWFRDYVYIPLGGSKRGTGRTCLNYLIVFVLTGLWHGASYNFIAWGLFYAVFIIVERLGWGRVLQRLPRAIRHIYTMGIVVIGWVFFRAEGLRAAIAYLKGMFTCTGQDVAYFNFVMNRQYWFFIIVGIICAVPHKRLKDAGESLTTDLGAMLVFACAICYMIGSGYSPFLYFRF